MAQAKGADPLSPSRMGQDAPLLRDRAASRSLADPPPAAHLRASPATAQGATTSAGASAAAPAAAGALRRSLGQLTAGAAEMQRLIQEVMGQADAERSALQGEWERLEAERAAFRAETERVHQVAAAGAQLVELNVGGTRFTTSVATLANAPPPCLFSAMFSGRHAVPLGPDGAVFIDRDPRCFGDVLNFLRDGALAYPPPHQWPAAGGCTSLVPGAVGVGAGAAAAAAAHPAGPDWRYLLSLRAEAEFYGLTALVEAVDRYPWGLVTVARAGHIDADDRWEYSEGADELAFRVDRPCLLLGVGLAGPVAPFTVDFKVMSFQGDLDLHLDNTWEAAEVHSRVMQSFTAADGRVVRLMLPSPLRLVPDTQYMLCANIQGHEGLYCEGCLQEVVAGGVRVTFQDWESPNGTCETRGQFPEFYIRPL